MAQAKDMTKVMKENAMNIIDGRISFAFAQCAAIGVEFVVGIHPDIGLCHMRFVVEQVNGDDERAFSPKSSPNAEALGRS
jgi:hypothetical protein